MTTAEEMLAPLRGGGNFINCVDYEEALQSMIVYAKEIIKECAERAKIKYNQGIQPSVNKESILSLINELT